MTRTGRPIRPVVIAHRGASGYLPEHTLPAKALAYAMGADYLEQDLVASKDDELIVIHDAFLDRTTNVAELFPTRHREDGRWYVRDFTLEEIRMLDVHERKDADGNPVYPDRYPVDGDVFQLHTFAEELRFVEHLRNAVGRPVGIYPEIKHPALHRQAGVDITALVLAELKRFGYSKRDDAVYLQCFDAQELKRVREEFGAELKLVQLIGENDWREAPVDYERMRSKRGLAGVADVCDAIGPWINQLYDIDATGGRPTDTGLVAMAHQAGLGVHPYTARRDSLPPGFGTFRELVRFLIDELRVDGLFTDFPDLVTQKCGEG